jgi:hypothetical protein
MSSLRVEKTKSFTVDDIFGLTFEQSAKEKVEQISSLSVEQINNTQFNIYIESYITSLAVEQIISLAV